jgi:hypothetical protein
LRKSLFAKLPQVRAVNSCLQIPSDVSELQIDSLDLSSKILALLMYQNHLTSFTFLVMQRQSFEIQKWQLTAQTKSSQALWTSLQHFEAEFKSAVQLQSRLLSFGVDRIVFAISISSDFQQKLHKSAEVGKTIYVCQMNLDQVDECG